MNDEKRWVLVWYRRRAVGGVEVPADNVNIRVAVHEVLDEKQPFETCFDGPPPKTMTFTVEVTKPGALTLTERTFRVKVERTCGLHGFASVAPTGLRPGHPDA